MSIDERVPSSQIQKAVKSLLAHSQKKKKETLEEGKTLFADEDENMWLVVTTKTMHPSLTLKPQRIPLAHPVVDPRISPVCLITKDPQRTYKDLLQKHNINFISRVVGITKLKGKFAPYDARRQLAGDYGLFLADERVIPLLPGLLGKAFFKKKKQPIPVNLLKKDLKSELEAAISSTYLHQNAGTCTSIKIAHTGMDSKKIIKNVETSIPAVVRKLHHVNTRRKPHAKDKKVGEIVPKSKDTKSEEELKQEQEEAWENIQSLGIKTHSSVCLPIWSCDLNDRWISAPPASASPIAAVTNGTKSARQSTNAHEEEDDTMSEGEGDHEELDRKLSEKMKKSSLGSPKKKSNDTLPDERTETKKKKRKAEGDEEGGGAVKKTKLLSVSKNSSDNAPKTSDSTISSITAKRKPSSQSDATLSSQDEEALKKGKSDRAKAADFMEEEDDALPEKASSLPKAGNKAVSKSAAKPGTSQLSTNEKKDKEKKKAEVEMSESVAKGSKTTNGTTPTPLSSSNAAPAASTPATLKSALKKNNGASLTPAELSQKKAKKTTFSVVEKKKDKLNKGLISDKGGKSKIGLVGRGPKM